MTILGVSGGNTILETLAPEYGFGNDIIGVLIGSTSNFISTAEGNDTVYTTRATVSQFAWLGSGNDRLYGGAALDLVRDGSGNDYVWLSGGSDTAYLSLGNDYYNGGAGIDTINFNGLYTDYFDFIGDPHTFGVTLDLAKTTRQNLGYFGFDTIVGFENVVGGDGHDRIYGNALANELNGAGGHDILDGRAGNDVLYSNNGADWLIGGPGRDQLFMEETVALRDRAVFRSILDSSANPALSDLVWSFDKGGAATDDKIDLSAIDANPLLAGNQAFIFRGAGAFTAIRGEVRVVSNATDTYVFVDNDTDAAAEMIIIVKGVTGLTGGDFIL